jgi:predicted GIY-YIG superfamily endonuclease
MLEHKEGRTPSLPGKNPKLLYFEVLPSCEQSMSRETDIKQLLKKNHREFMRMVVRFRDLIREVGVS